MAQPTRVYLDTGKTWTFACAVDWPGWCRRAKGPEAALLTLLAYQERYSIVAGPGFEPGEPEMIGEVRGDALADFGAPGGRGAWDDEGFSVADADRWAAVVAACWHRFDEVAADAPAELRRGPRGGGRQRDAIVDHVREAERTYGRKFGVRLPPRTPWSEQRTQFLAALRAGGQADGGRSLAAGASWPLRYAFRRIAWHVLDHAWEIEDRA
ncbi:MAG TPA: hypothetical protein VHT30_02565 [Acidimicrobiales bacterium]|nr:hypothetical protein [Acidimicrobiales bacterium]